MEAANKSLAGSKQEQAVAIWPSGCVSSSAQAAYLGKACAQQGGARRCLAATRRLGKDQQRDPKTKQLREAAFCAGSLSYHGKAC